MGLVIRTNRLSRYYPAIRRDPVKAVDGIDWELPAGELAIVSGPSGSGKTTLLGLIAGLDRPNSGSVELFGQRLAELSDAAVALLRRRRIGILFQDFKLLPNLSCWENVALPLTPMGVSRRTRRRRAERLLERFGIGEVMDQPPEQTSGGQQQRVALARALINEPELLLADEPTSQIDPDSAGHVLDALREMVGNGKTVVVTTHDPTLLAGATRRFHMSAGRLEAAG